MTQTTLKRPGARISISSRRAGGHPRTGKILEVLGAPGHEHYRVRWDDGEESYFYPTQADERAARPARASARRTRAQAGQATERRLWAAPGDRLVVHGHRQGEPERDAEILEVRGSDGGPPFLVRWADTGSETLLYPGSDATVEHFRRRRREG